MSTDEEVFEKLYKKYHTLKPIEQALEQWRNGEPATIHCPTCGTLVVVTQVRGIGSIWVTCEKNCTFAHFQGKGKPS